jgi:hypothetical protein
MTERSIMRWYKENLQQAVEKAIALKKEKNPELLYTTDWLLAMAYRETWTLVARYIKNKIVFENVLTVVKGDYGKRDGETEKQFHGFGFWQIDIGSYPQFVKSGDWKDPFKCCCKAIDVLEEKRLYLESKFDKDDFNSETFQRMITAAYNCGQGNVTKAVNAKLGMDYYTHEKNYSQMVWKYRELYNSLT